MAQKNKQNSKSNQEASQTMKAQPWIPMRVGVIIIAITSVVMGVLTAWQAIPQKGVLNGILYGVMFGGFIWIIFFGNILINRFLRK